MARYLIGQKQQTVIDPNIPIEKLPTITAVKKSKHKHKNKKKKAAHQNPVIRIFKRSQYAELNKEDGLYYHDGYAFEPNGVSVHRKIVKKRDGKIREGWVVHHCDFDKTNNESENLVQMPRKLHDIIHKTGRFGKPTKDRIEKEIIPWFFETHDFYNKKDLKHSQIVVDRHVKFIVDQICFFKNDVKKDFIRGVVEELYRHVRI